MANPRLQADVVVDEMASGQYGYHSYGVCVCVCVGGGFLDTLCHPSLVHRPHRIACTGPEPTTLPPPTLPATLLPTLPATLLPTLPPTPLPVTVHSAQFGFTQTPTPFRFQISSLVCLLGGCFP